MTTYVNNSSIRIINSQKPILLTADNTNVIIDRYNVYTIYTILILNDFQFKSIQKKSQILIYFIMTSKSNQDNKLGVSNLDSYKSDITQQIAHKIISSL